MKRTVAFLTFFICISVISRAQLAGAGGGIGFTSGYSFSNQSSGEDRSKQLFIFMESIFQLKGAVQLSPSLTFFIPSVTRTTSPTEESKISLNTIMVDINGHYVLKNSGSLELYGLAGLDIIVALRKEVVTVTQPDPSTDKNSESDNALGLNLGAGGSFRLSERFNLVIEAKYLLSRYDQFMVNAGIIINL